MDSLSISFSTDSLNQDLQKAAEGFYRGRISWGMKPAEKRRIERETKKTVAEVVTEGLQEIIARFEELIIDTAQRSADSYWQSLVDRRPFNEPKPEPPALPPSPALPEFPPEPGRTDPELYTPPTFFQKLVPSMRERVEAENEARYVAAHKRWIEQIGALEKSHAAAQRHYTERVAKIEAETSAARQEWEARRDALAQERQANNQRLADLKQAWRGGDPEALAFIVGKALERSLLPDMPSRVEVAMNAETGLMLVDCALPAPSDMPKLQEVRYVQSKDTFEPKLLPEKQRNALYDGVLYQMVLLRIRHAFDCDPDGHIRALCFNGYVTSINPADGNEVTACVLSLQVSRDEFEGINLAQVDPKACFKKLRGVGSSALHSITPVAPLVSMATDDRRFVESREVLAGVEEGDNLATMGWEDFEHLIRQLFEREFSAAGAEVKVTQASRDGGVDAVVFDPDPIRGGKIVIQAKRYTNTVGVSAVRDLYGTVMNEGATKGILVTTADFGPDAYQFASGKPLALLNGGNLLHLLMKHGQKARINIHEARQQRLEA